MEHKSTLPFKGTPEQAEKLAKVIEEHKGQDGAAIPVLHEAQEIYGYLPIEVQKMIAEGLDIPLSEIYGIATFYARFTLNPKGEYQIAVCLGTACYVKGSNKVLEKVKEILGIDVGECTPDGKFSIDATRCIGACGLAPVMTVNDDVYGRLVVDDVEGILKKYA
ncbi:MAG: NAD(P)H-dependent oxidoreductase subunit E [Clostridia bacterium]|nr:NAD(P)H-dependent oxidoreductase subunit E [Clostridia bacterium]